MFASPGRRDGGLARAVRAMYPSHTIRVRLFWRDSRTPELKVIKALQTGGFEAGAGLCAIERNQWYPGSSRRLSALSPSPGPPRRPYAGENKAPTPPCAPESPANRGIPTSLQKSRTHTILVRNGMYRGGLLGLEAATTSLRRLADLPDVELRNPARPVTSVTHSTPSRRLERGQQALGSPSGSPLRR